MKKFLSLMMVVAMLFAVLALVGCDQGNTDETSGNANSTTASSDDANSTTASSDNDAEDTTTTTEKEEETTTSTTTLPVFARFDFGKKSKGEAENLTSHAWLVENLTFNDDWISVDYTDDSIIVTADKDHPGIKLNTDENGKVTGENTDECAVDGFALVFNNIISYDFDGPDLKPGWGTWAGYPYTHKADGSSAWKGMHQYMQIRMINKSTNNIMSVQFKNPSNPGFATTQIAPAMYLQGGAPSVDNIADLKQTCEASEEWQIFTYDMALLGGLSRSTSTTSYIAWVYNVYTKAKDPGASNWHWSGTAGIEGLKFHVLGAYAIGKRCNLGNFADTREQIKAGATVEIDYILFGSTQEQLNGWTSYIEDVYNESVSIENSISASISESESVSASISASISESEAAATATTAASAS